MKTTELFAALLSFNLFSIQFSEAWSGDSWESITQAQIQAIANEMIDSSWTPNNTNNNYQYTKDGLAVYKTYYKGTIYTGIAYGQGNPQDDWSEFANYMAITGAGNYSYGNDCSGFLSICWKLPARNTTATLESGLGTYWAGLGSIGSSATVSLLPCDAINSSANGHVIIFLDYITGGIKAMEQTPDMAQRRSWTYSQLQNYRPIRRNAITGDSYPPLVRTDSATSIGATSAVLNGTITGDGGLSIVFRQFGWGTDPNILSNAIINSSISVSGSSFSATLSGLQPKTTYYYSASAKNATNSDWGHGQILSFKTSAVTHPSQATSPSPSSGATGLPSNLTLTWKNGGEATTYDVYFGTDPIPDSGEFAGNQTLTTFDPPILAYNTTYYWRIDARNSKGVTPGDVWSFTTITAGTTALQSWRQTYFSSIENSGDGADLNDFDKDGIPNLIEFAFGLHPKQNSAGMLPQARIVGTNLVVSFTQPVSVSGVSFGAEWSQTLAPGSWTSVSNSSMLPEHGYSVPIGAEAKLFMRLKVTNP